MNDDLPRFTPWPLRGSAADLYARFGIRPQVRQYARLPVIDPKARFAVRLTFGVPASPVEDVAATPVRVTLFSSAKARVEVDGPCPPGSRW